MNWSIGIDVLRRMAVKGGADPWVLFRGAAKYVKALATGDVADRDTAAHRAATCATCPHLTRGAEWQGESAGYCGPLGVETSHTCGCLVAVGIRAAGKALVGSEKCPSAKW